ncbi:T9SS type A sorting domain-containing protein [Chryseobacterium koreense]
MKCKFSFFLATISLLLTFLFSQKIQAQTITIDGQTNDWAAALQSNIYSIHIRDANKTNDNSFTQGSSDPNLISTWAWENGQTNSKGDISNAAAVLIGNKLYFAGDRTAINGDAQIGFWFFRDGVAPNSNFKFTGQHQIGDILVLSNFTNGGGVANLKIYEWVGAGGSAGTLNLLGQTSNGFVNSTYQNTPAYPGWTYQGDNVPSVGTPPPNVYATGSFFEGYVDLGTLGIGTCIGSFLLETRNSASISASLQDFAAGDFNVKPAAPSVVNGQRCGPGIVTMSATCVNGSGVRWYSSASGGQPLGQADGVSADGNSISVNTNTNVTYYASCYRSGSNCESSRVPVTGTIKSPPTVTLSGGPILCHDGTAVITATVTGGSGNYSYTWTKDGSAFTNPGGGNVIQAAGPGSYSVIVTDTTQQCSSSSSNVVTLTNPTQVSVTLAGGPILCHDADVTLTATAVGGNGSYTYEWYSNGTLISGASGSTYVTHATGSYTVQVKDGNNCPATSNAVTLTNPTQVSVTLAGGPILCHDADVTLTATAVGGNGSYTYEWYSNGTLISGASGSTYVTHATGSYTVQVKDGNNCPATSNAVTLTNPTQVSVTLAGGPILCHDADVTLTATAVGGNGSYTYEWYSNGTLISGASGSTYVTHATGSYTVQVKDGNNCPATSNAVTLTNPTQVSVTLAGGPILCHDADVTLTATAVGGNGSYTYEWYSNGTLISGASGSTSVTHATGSYTVQVKDGNNCPATSNAVTLTNPTQVSVTLAGGPILCHDADVTLTATAVGGNGSYTYEWYSNGTLISGASGSTYVTHATGSYTVQVKDGNNCPATSNAVTLTNPTQVSVTLAGGPILCHDADVTLTATAVGGNGSYTYEWYSNGTLISGASGSTYVTHATGSYTVQVKDGNNCPATSNAVTLTNPTQVSVTLAGGPILCHDADVTLTATAVGGNGSYTYEWYSNGTLISGASGSTYVTHATGSYTVQVKDGNNCPATSNAVTLTNPTQVSVTLAGGPILCHDADVTLTATAVGGNGSYTYEWYSNGTLISGASGSTYVTHATGSYTVQVKDGNNCPATSNAVTLTNPTQVSVTLAGGPILCHDADVTLTATAVGGNGSYTYEWYSNGTLISGASGSTYVTHATGSYTVQVKDGNNCPATSNAVTLTNPTQVSVTLAGGPILCHDADVTLTATAVGGNGSYTYEWYSNGTLISGASGSTYVTHATGSYTVQVKDGNNCPATSNAVTLTNPTQVSVTLAGGPILCHDADVTLTATAVGGNGSYTYEWYSNGTLISGASGSTSVTHATGSYTVQVKDGNNCPATSNAVTLTNPTQVSVTLAGGPILCHDADVTLTATAVGGNGSYTYEWYSNGTLISGASGSTYVTHATGSYTVQVKDGNNCPATSNAVTLTNPEQLNITANPGVVSCSASTASVTFTPTGGTAPYSIYMDGNLIATVNGVYVQNNVVGGTHTYYVKDANGCQTAQQSFVVNAALPIAVTVDAPDVLCYGGTSLVTLTISGGISPYTVAWFQNGVQVATGNPINLGVGSYTAIVTDSVGCNKTIAVTVKLKSCQGKTITQGGWGAPANGGNNGMYLNNNFASVFTSPDYLTIGDGSRKVRLTSPDAIRTYIKNGGTAAILGPGLAVNPPCPKNTLASQTVALTLNIRFDAANPNWAPYTDTTLGDMIVVQGPLAGYTVNQVLTLANQILGGTSTQMTPSAINSVVSSINENFDNGNTNQGYLACPCVTYTKPIATTPVKETSTVQEAKVTLYPNPTKGDINLKFDTDQGKTISVQLYNYSGKMIDDLSRLANWNGNTVSINYNNPNLTDGVYLLKVKTSTIEKMIKLIIKK